MYSFVKRASSVDVRDRIVANRPIAAPWIRTRPLKHSAKPSARPAATNTNEYFLINGFLRDNSIDRRCVSDCRICLQVYQKHNRNLIGDDDLSDIEMVMRRRLSSVSTAHTGSGRFPQAISSIFNSPMSSPGTPTSPGSPSAAAANPSTPSFDGASHFLFSGNEHK